MEVSEMDYSVLITRFLGIVFAVYGLGILFNGKRVKQAGESLSHNVGLSWVIGISQLFWGSFFVVVQQVWTNWSVMTTLAGWLIFLSGVFRLWTPNSIAKCDSSSSCGAIGFFGFVLFVWGVLMMFYGFFGSLHGMVATYHQVIGSTPAQ
jgi:hypothetical protein